MACKCLNADGSLAAFCNGTCVNGSILIQNGKEHEPYLCGECGSIVGQKRGRVLLSQEQKIAMLELFEMKIAQLRLDVNQEAQDKYKNSFIEGFERGFKLAKEYNDCEY